MNNLQLFSKIKRRNRSLLTEPQQKLYKNASQAKQLSPFSKLEKPFQLSTLEHAKILPKNILYDKQSLYLEVLTLKMELNQIVDENLRLKTKIINLEKQMEMGNHKTIVREKSTISRIKKDKYDTIRNNQVLLIDNLKKIIKEMKKQSQDLKNQNAKMKKNVKVSKVNELEIEISLLIDENRRVSSRNEQLQQRLESFQAKNLHLEKGLLSKSNEIKHLEQQNVTLKSYIKAMQLQHKYEVTSLNVNQRKPIRQFALERRKNIPSLRQDDQYKNKILINKESSFRINKKEHLKAMRVQYNMFPIRRQPINNRPSKQTLNEKGSIKSEILHQQHYLHDQHNKQELTSKELLEDPTKKDEQIANTIQNSKQIPEIKEKTPKKQERTIHIEPDQKSMTKQDKQRLETAEGQRMEYSSVQNQGFNSKKRPQTHQSGPRAFSEPQPYNIKSKSIFKSNKKIIAQICQLVTYRMLAQRYTYDELKTDIQQSPSKQFSYIDLCHMFVNEPFYLTVQYCRILLCFMLEKQRPVHSDTINSLALIAKLRQIVKDFECISQEQQHKIIENCANIITEHSKSIKQAFNYAKNQNITVRHADLKEMLLRYNLSQTEVNLMIGQLSICSHDLAHLSLDVLFERFDLNQVESNREQSNIIEEAQNDDSFMNSKHKEEANKIDSVDKNHNITMAEQKNDREWHDSKKMRHKMKLDYSNQT